MNNNASDLQNSCFMYMGGCAEWSEHLQLKQEALGSIPGGCPGFQFFSLQAGLLVDEICGALVQLGCYINRDMNGKIYGGLVQFSCYQHRMELGV